MKKTTQRNKVDPEIPTGSMADIAFLLIVFFMLTTVIAINRGIFFKVPEPAEDEKPQDIKEAAIYLHVTDDGQFIMDQKPAQLNDIKPYCRQKLTVNPNKPLIIHCAANARYQDMINLLDEVKQLEEEMYGEFNRGKPLKEQKRIRITIPTLEEAERYQNL